MQRRVFVPWEDSTDVQVRVARHLVRQPQSLTTTALCQALGIAQPPGEVAARLRDLPGLFTEVSRGRWSMTRDAAEHGLVH